ncbi:MAG: hypothetical protein LBI19_08435 [Oscillospiraceae bacterium]|jgi:hypothetical protein|nr:hypothetical protein [Oscillospiraceae bacterium]
MKTKHIIALLIAAVLAAGMFAGCDSNQKPYEEAEALFSEGEYSKAAKAFEALGDYKDAPEKAKEVREYVKNVGVNTGFASGSVDVFLKKVARDGEKVKVVVNIGLILSSPPKITSTILYVGNKPIEADEGYTYTFAGDHTFTFTTDQQPKSIRIDFGVGRSVEFDTETKKVIW